MSAFNIFRDGLVNVLTGRGTSADKSAHSYWMFAKRTPEQVLAAYRSNWLIAKIIDLPAQDMTREWRDWKAENAEIEKLEQLERDLDLRAKFQLALTYGRLGGGAIIMGFGDANPAIPPSQSASIEYVHVVSRYNLSIGTCDNDPASPYFGMPTSFVMSSSGRQIRIHPSRVIVFKGCTVPDFPGATWEDVFWGDSVIDRVDQAVKNACTASDGFAALIDEAKIDIYRFAGLVETLMQDGGDEKMLQRITATNLGKSTHRAVILDKEDEWEQRQINWSGMPDVIRTFYSLVAGAADIPATRLFGKSPDGMNATGESDEKNYRSSISTGQNTYLRPAFDKIDPYLFNSLGITSTPGWEFAPISSLSEKEAADVAKVKADTAVAYANSGLVPIDALATGVQNGLVEDGTYPGLEQALEDMPDTDMPADNTDPNELVTSQAKGGDRSSAGSGGGSGSGSATDRATNDAKPIPLYVQRKLLNAGDLIKWAKAQGFESTLEASDMHVTVLYSRASVDPIKMGESWNGDENGNLTIKPGGPRAIERLGENAVVLLFASSDLAWRHESMIREGASHDYPEYQPHVTISYNIPEGMDIEAIKPYNGKLEFGPEIFEPLDLDWKTKITEA